MTSEILTSGGRGRRIGPFRVCERQPLTKSCLDWVPAS